MSHPSRGVWVEIGFPPVKVAAWSSHTPRRVRGLKFIHEAAQLDVYLIVPLAEYMG